MIVQYPENATEVSLRALDAHDDVLVDETENLGEDSLARWWDVPGDAATYDLAWDENGPQRFDPFEADDPSGC